MTWHTTAREWHSGRWTLQLRGDELADVAFDGRIALRSIRAVVRDRNWDTADLVVDDVTAEAARLLLSVHTEGLGSHLDGTLSVQAADAELTVDLDLAVRQGFWTNRTGLVVLHPPSTAGTPLRVEHSGGTEETTRFPIAISPHQPVFDIVELAWTDGGLDVDVRFSGDTFEMEDQRNWTDASFKTYNRALALPFPYELEAGSHVHQSLRIRARTATERVEPRGDAIELVPEGTFPDLVVGAATAPDPAPTFEPVGRAVLVELDLATRNWRAVLNRAASSGLPLDVRFVLADAAPAAILDGACALRGLALAVLTRVVVDVGEASGVELELSSSAARSHGGFSCPTLMPG